MRRLIVLLILLGASALVRLLGEPGSGAQWLMTFGFLILGAYSVGELVSRIGLPKIIGYLAAGFVFGPRVLGVVTSDAAHRLAPVSGLAIALIAFLAGAELRWSEVRSRGPTIAKLLGAEITVTFVLLAGATALFGDALPFIRASGGLAELAAFSLLFASIAVVHSPAVTMALLSETRAEGPVARTTLGVVLVSDVAVVLLFSGALALARVLAPPSGLDATGSTVGAVIWEIAGAAIVGAALGALVALYLRFLKQELFLFALVMAFLGSLLARALHVEVLLTLLTAGFVAENVSPREIGDGFRHAMERAATPVFVVFFALAGAELSPASIAASWTFVIPIVVLRIVGIRVGTWLGGRWASAPVEGRYVWMGLVSQAGVAIGLASAVAQAYPERGVAMRDVFFAVIAVNELLGPILFRVGLTRAGEIGALPQSETTEAVAH
ncbi:MAG: cation:proton antiporter [Gemmatimonadaceae bacterium]|nr:cation:proton antiporter [Gemmatimonadaceae bacterium]